MDQVGLKGEFAEELKALITENSVNEGNLISNADKDEDRPADGPDGSMERPVEDTRPIVVVRPMAPGVDRKCDEAEDTSSGEGQEDALRLVSFLWLISRFSLVIGERLPIKKVCK